jgi:hypothetical protein
MAEAATRAAHDLPESPWVGVAPVPRAPVRPAPTATLRAVPAERRQRGRLWPGLIPIVAGAVMLLVAVGLVLTSIDRPIGGPVSPGDGGVQPTTGVSPQQTVTDRPDGQDDGGDDNRGPGGGGGGHGRG